MEVEDNKKEYIEELIEKSDITDLPSEEVVQEALSGNYKMMWKIFKILNGNKEFELLKRYVKYGIMKGFNIDFAVREEWLSEYPNSHKVKIQGYNKFKLEDFNDEINLREGIMMKTMWKELGQHPEGQE